MIKRSLLSFHFIKKIKNKKATIQLKVWKKFFLKYLHCQKSLPFPILSLVGCPLHEQMLFHRFSHLQYLQVQVASKKNSVQNFEYSGDPNTEHSKNGTIQIKDYSPLFRLPSNNTGIQATVQIVDQNVRYLICGLNSEHSPNGLMI